MDYCNVLITGVAGFMGSHLAIFLVKKYQKINFVAIDKISYCSNVKNFLEVMTMPNFKYQQLDFTDFDQLDQLFEKYKFDAIIHLGAYTHVDHSFGNSLLFTHNNVVGTHMLLEVARKYGIKRFLHMSTDEIYGSKETILTEESLLDPTNPYSATKAAAEHLVKSYYHSFKLPIVIVRSNNTYGARQFPEKVVPKFILRLLGNKKCQIQGSGNQKRTFVYIDDFVQAIDIILNKGKNGEIYNIASSDEMTINELATMIVKQLAPNKELIEYVKDREFNDIRYHIDAQKLYNLGWRQNILLNEGLAKTIDWYKNNQDYWSDEQLGSLLE